MELIVWHEPNRISHADAEAKTRFERHPAVEGFAVEVDPDLVSGGDGLGHLRLSLKDSLVPRIRYLAGKHKLVCYDPVQRAVLNPPVLRRAGAHELTFCIGHSIDDPSPRHLADAVRNLSDQNWFVVLNDADDHFVQVARVPGTHILEFKDVEHFQTEVSDASTVIEALVDQASGDKGWRDRFVWRPLQR